MIPAAGLPQVVVLRDAREVRRFMERARVSPAGMDIMDRKGIFRAVWVRGVDARALSVLKQEMLSRGGEVAVPRDVHELGEAEADALILGTLIQYERLLPKLWAQPFGLRPLADAIATALRHYDMRVAYCHPALDLSFRPRLVGVLNVTPDSFSDGGEHMELEAAVAAAHAMVNDGASVIEVGGESTRPGAAPVPADIERQRVVPVIRVLAGELPVPLAVDTYKAEVAGAAVEAGATIVNDITALRGDPGMLDVGRETGCGLVLMHMQREPQTMQLHPAYDHVVEDIYAFFVERLSWAVDQGVPEKNLIVDPGIGFGKTREHNLELLRNLKSFRSLGRPVMVGTSRKAFLGGILDLPNPKDRMIGTVATTVMATLEDADLIRVHDVAENYQAIRVTRSVHPIPRD